MKFSCDNCSVDSACCRNFKETFIDPELIKQQNVIQNNGPIYSALTLEEKRLPLYGWELDRLRDSTEIGFNASPRSVLFDLKAKKKLVIQWNLDHDDCPFLNKEGACTVYDVRFVHCRVFPLSGSGLKGRPLTISSICPNIINPDVKDGMDVASYVKLMYDIYGDVFLWALQRDFIVNWVKNTIQTAINNGLVKPVHGKPYEKAMKDFEYRKPIDFFEHLKSINNNLSTMVDSQVENFSNLKEAHDFIGQYL